MKKQKKLNGYKLSILAYLTGLLQIFLIGLQVKHFAENKIIPAFLTSILISSVWCFNVNAVIKSWSCRIAYVLGAGTGAVLSIIFYGVLNG